MGTQLEPEGLAKFVDTVIEELELKSVVEDYNGLEITKRQKGNESFYFVINLTDENKKIPMDLVGKVDLLTGDIVEKDFDLNPFGVAIIN